MGSTIEMILTVIGLSFWILFPIGMFLSVSKVDKNTDQIIRLDSLEQNSAASVKTVGVRDRIRDLKARHFDWHHPFANVGRWFQHH